MWQEVFLKGDLFYDYSHLLIDYDRQPLKKASCRNKLLKPKISLSDLCRRSGDKKMK